MSIAEMAYVRVSILFCIVVVTVESTCLKGNRESYKFVEVQANILCRFQISFYRSTCVSDPDVIYDTALATDTLPMNILGHECTFSPSKATCLCKGSNCNDEKHSREILAKQLATTDSQSVRETILCILTGGDEAFEVATKQKVPPPRTKRFAEPTERNNKRHVRVRRWHPATKTSESSTPVVATEAGVNHHHEGSAAKHHHHDHSVSFVVTTLIMEAIALVIIILIIIALVMMVIYVMRIVKRSDNNKMTERTQSEDSITPPQQFEESMRSYSRSLYHSPLDPGLK